MSDERLGRLGRLVSSLALTQSCGVGCQSVRLEGQLPIPDGAGECR